MFPFGQSTLYIVGYYVWATVGELLVAWVIW